MEEEIMYFQELIEFFKVKETYKVDGMIEFGMEDFKKLQSLFNRLEQDERVIEEMASKLKEIQDEYLDFCPDCVDLAKELLKIIEHFRKKCE